MRILQRGAVRRPPRRMDSPRPVRDTPLVTQRDLKRLASEVVSARERLGVTQEEFALLCDLSLPTIQRVERAKGVPRGTTYKGLDSGAGWQPGSARAVVEHSRPPKHGQASLGDMTWDEVSKEASRIAKMIGGKEGDDAAARVILAWTVARDEAMERREGVGGETHVE